METAAYSSTFQSRIYWLGYLGLLPFIASTIVLLWEPNDTQLIFAIQSYAAIILTFVGAIHWGRALYNHDYKLLSFSVTPSLLAWLSLLIPIQASMPLLILGFLTMLRFDRNQYQTQNPSFLRTRIILTTVVCICLILIWLKIIF